jgi:hypothetical protein
MPQGSAVWKFRKRKDFFDSSIAIGGHDQKRRGPPSVSHAEDDVVVKLALLPVFEELETSEALTKSIKQLSENQLVSEGLNDGRGHYRKGLAQP